VLEKASMSSIAENMQTIQERIAAAARRVHRDPSSARLIAVTKTIGQERIREAVAAGAMILGENRVQEAREKIAGLGPIASWHLIGHLQTNKAKYAVTLFYLIHSVDSIELARELSRQAEKHGKVQDILIEVNVSGETSKEGVGPGGAMDLIREAAKLGNVRVQGLMTIPPFAEDPEASRPHFRKLRELAEDITKEQVPNVVMKELSMGMSGDFEVAVEEGSTLVRVGTAIFGKRT
jgi:pyridoxal phosphate enzyme (YggS family)